MDVTIEGKLLKFPDDLDIGKDGSIYFSDASTNIDPSLMVLELLGLRRNGMGFVQKLFKLVNFRTTQWPSHKI